jgi:sugar phosphate isomerase/epimerase
MLFGAMNFPIKPLRDEIERIAQLGFDFAEISMDAPFAHYTGILEDKKALQRQLKDCGLSVVCHLPTFVSAADLTPGIRAAAQNEMMRSLEAAAELYPMKISVHPAIISGLGIFMKETVKDYAMEYLESLVFRAKALGVTLCLENMFPRYGHMTDPEEFLPVLNRFPELSFLLDVGHARIGAEGSEKIVRFIELLGDRLGHLHLSDNKGKIDDHFALGDGSIDYNSIVRALKKTGYDSTVTFEVFNTGPERLIESRERFSTWMADQ